MYRPRAPHDGAGRDHARQIDQRRDSERADHRCPAPAPEGERHDDERAQPEVAHPALPEQRIAHQCLTVVAKRLHELGRVGGKLDGRTALFL